MRSDDDFGQRNFETDKDSVLVERFLSGASFSGHERNHVFLNQGGEDYVEVSGVSGLDHPGDSRAFAVLDYDRDGWSDLAVVNSNAPLFQLYRNQMGEREGATGGMIAVRFEGGNRSSDANDQWSARDGYGARVLTEIGDRTLLREHRAGEGLAALVEKHVIALVSAEGCPRPEPLMEPVIHIVIQLPRVFIRAHNCAPEVRSYVYGQLDCWRWRVVPAQGIEIEIGVVVQIDELTAPPPACLFDQQSRSLEAGDTLEFGDSVTVQAVPVGHTPEVRIDVGHLCGDP